VNARIAELIREQRTSEIPEAIAAGEFHDMQTAQKALIELVVDRVVDQEVAAAAAVNRHDFLLKLEHALKERALLAEGGVEGELTEPAVPGLRLAARTS